MAFALLGLVIFYHAWDPTAVATALVLCVLVARIGVGRKRDLALTLGLAALAAGILKELSDWNWYGFSGNYAGVNLIDLAIQFALAGVVIGWRYKREMRGAPAAGGTAGVR